VFVDGCYWHGSPDHGRVPATNVPYWSAKLARNVTRDRRNDLALAQEGWTGVRAWEHEAIDVVVSRVGRALRDRDAAVLTDRG